MFIGTLTIGLSYTLWWQGWCIVSVVADTVVLLVTGYVQVNYIGM